MGQRHEAEAAVQKGTVINEHKAMVKWYNEPVEMEAARSEATEDYAMEGVRFLLVCA
jgi:hypothetical protein